MGLLIDEPVITIPGMSKRIFWGECDYREERFVTFRMLEKARFTLGVEIQIEFQGRNPFEGFAMARKAAMVYAGLLTPAGNVYTIPFVSDMGPYRGRALGSQTSNTKQGWRIDCSQERTEGFHVNWWDRRRDGSPTGTRNRDQHYYGGNYVVGGGQNLFWQLEPHFPGQLEPKNDQ